MKTLIVLLAFITFSGSGFTQAYYWVGNGGAWSDLTHWATTSGGDTFHTELPGADHDVYFDANSFTESDQVVVLDLADAACKTFDASAALFEPLFEGVQNFDVLNVYGDFIVPDNVDRKFRRIDLRGSGDVNIITGGRNLGPSSNLRTQGDGVYHQNDSLVASNFEFRNGTFLSHGHPIYSRIRFRAFDIFTIPTLDLSYSTIYTDNLVFPEDCAVNLSYTTIHFGINEATVDVFNGGGKDFYHVIFYQKAQLFGDNSFVLFEALPGTRFWLFPESIQEAAQFIFTGTEEQPIELKSSTEGTEGYLKQDSGLVYGEYLEIQDVHAIGDGSFYAVESVDLGNNDGWFFGAPEEEDEEENETAVQGRPAGRAFAPYPNPANTHIVFSTEPLVEYIVIGSNGAIMSRFIARGFSTRIDLSAMPNGRYLLKPLNDPHLGVSQFVIQR